MKKTLFACACFVTACSTAVDSTRSDPPLDETTPPRRPQKTSSADVPAPDAEPPPPPAMDAGRADATPDAHDAAPDVVATCTCTILSASGAPLTRPCGASFCWKPPAASVLSKWVCADDDLLSPTFQPCAPAD